MQTVTGVVTYIPIHHPWVVLLPMLLVFMISLVTSGNGHRICMGALIPPKASPRQMAQPILHLAPTGFVAAAAGAALGTTYVPPGATATALRLTGASMSGSGSPGRFRLWLNLTLFILTSLPVAKG